MLWRLIRLPGRSVFGCLVLCWFGLVAGAEEVRLDPFSDETLVLPKMSAGAPAAGKRVAVTPKEYAGTEVFHTIYLPPHWKPSGPALPIVFEYTGNRFPLSGSTGKLQDAALGYAISGGKCIWVCLPYINASGDANEVTWWGDEGATIEYAKQNVPRIMDQFQVNRNAVILCGFSRGAIGVNYLGLHDDEIAKLWTAFLTHDHFDGVREWKTTWGSPLNRYRHAASQRLLRVGDRPFWVSQNGRMDSTEQFVRSVLSDPQRFVFESLNTRAILGEFPNVIAKAPHTDRWAMVLSASRQRVWAWMNEHAFDVPVNRSPR